MLPLSVKPEALIAKQSNAVVTRSDTRRKDVVELRTRTDDKEVI